MNSLKDYAYLPQIAQASTLVLFNKKIVNFTHKR